VAVPAAAGSSDTSATPPGVGTLSQQSSPSAAPSPTASASTGTGSTNAGTQQPATAATTTAPDSSCTPGSLPSFLAVLTCATQASGGANPVTTLVTQIQGLAAGGGAPGLSPAPIEALAACVQSNLTAASPNGAKVEGCFSTFAESVTGAPQAKCLDPLLQGALNAIQALVQNQNPAPLQGVLTGLPATVTTLTACLQGGTTNTPVGTTSTGTTTSSGGATTPTDPTEAVPVAATPNFTG